LTKEPFGFLLAFLSSVQSCFLMVESSMMPLHGHGMMSQRLKVNRQKMGPFFKLQDGQGLIAQGTTHCQASVNFLKLLREF
jgi:hypothetical protein